MNNPEYNRCGGVDTFESRDRQRILIFNRRTGELMMLVSRSADLWRSLGTTEETDLAPADHLVLESLRRRGFIELVEPLR